MQEEVVIMQRHQRDPISQHTIQEGVSSATMATPPLVGRGAEMAQMATRLSHAADRRGGALFLVGEAGIGKPRLAHETLTLAREQGFLVLEGSAYALEGRLAYAPILAAFGPFLRHLDSSRQVRLVSGLPDLGRLKGRSEEHTSELQSHLNLVCRLLLEKKIQHR